MESGVGGGVDGGVGVLRTISSFNDLVEAAQGVQV